MSRWLRHRWRRGRRWLMGYWEAYGEWQFQRRYKPRHNLRYIGGE